MNPDETPEDQNTRLALALLEDDEGALDEILRCFGSAMIKSLADRHAGDASDEIRVHQPAPQSVGECPICELIL